MKKMIALLLALTLLLAPATALALSPQTPEVLKKAVAGQTFMATCRGYESVGERFSLYILLYEYARYSEADILAIEGTDYISADVGSAMIYSVTPGDEGFVLNASDANADPVYLVPDGAGSYFAKAEDGSFYLKEALELACEIAPDAQYFDASDPAAHTAQELVDAVSENREAFEDIEVTFDDDGRIALLKIAPAQ